MRRLLVVLALVVVASPALARKNRHRKHAHVPPVAFYLAQYGSVKAATREAALSECHAREAKDYAEHPELRPYFEAGECERTLVEVRGPYVRRGPVDEYDDPKVYVYKGSDGGWYDVTGDSPCIEEGTLIATATGNRPIESFVPGDTLLSWDPGQEQIVIATVVRVKRRDAKPVGTIVFSDGRTVGATSNHPFWTSGGWIPAGRLHAGDAVLELSLGQARPARIDVVSAFDRRATVYDLTVARTHDYFAGGLLVHNY
jgi:hypothetical protein